MDWRDGSVVKYTGCLRTLIPSAYNHLKLYFSGFQVLGTQMVSIHIFRQNTHFFLLKKLPNVVFILNFFSCVYIFK